MLLTILISLEDLTFKIDVQIRFFLSFLTFNKASFIIKSFENFKYKTEVHFIPLNSLNTEQEPSLTFGYSALKPSVIMVLCGIRKNKASCICMVLSYKSRSEKEAAFYILFTEICLKFSHMNINSYVTPIITSIIILLKYLPRGNYVVTGKSS